MEIRCDGRPLAQTRFPTTNSGWRAEMEAQLARGYVIHVFAPLAPTKFLHRSSVGSLFRLRCWLGRQICEMALLVVLYRPLDIHSINCHYD